ncbi:hypothetical protein IIA79_07670 [bacterium]|nr:hypothetical protein [bacterium]
MDQQFRQPKGFETFSASGADAGALREQLAKEAQGQELYFQEVEGEDGALNVFGYPRGKVMDLIYDLAYPVVKILDDHASLKVKSNRAVTDFFVIILTRRPGNFIGKHGQTLDAMETMVGYAMSRRFPARVSLSLDVDNYRGRRQTFLESMVKKVIREIERDHRERQVPDLLPKERRFIHQHLTDHPYLTTESRGAGRDRTLYILPREDIKET